MARAPDVVAEEGRSLTLPVRREGCRTQRGRTRRVACDPDVVAEEGRSLTLPVRPEGYRTQRGRAPWMGCGHGVIARVGARVCDMVPLAYRLTFRCYGTWLHGDARGSVDRRSAVVGAPLVAPRADRQRYEHGLLRHPPMRLDASRRPIVERAIREVCDHRGWRLYTLAVRSNHVHVVVSAGGAPEQALVAFKAYATRRMVEAGVLSAGVRPWSRHGSTRYLKVIEEVERTCRYVLEEQGAVLDEE